MSEEIKVSMIGVDGKVRWIDQRVAKTMVEKGWQYIQNPKEVYYPQYDQTTAQIKKGVAPDDVKVFLVENANNRLGVVIL